MRSVGDVAVIIPARDEAERIVSTVTAARQLPGVDVVVVADDGSVDATATVARDAGARVVRHDTNRGKGAAMASGAEAVGLIEQHDGRDEPRHLLFLDADLGTSAKEASPLADPVRAGEADMTVAHLPADRQRLGGHGLVVRLARAGIRHTTGYEPAQPLNGQRCLTRRAFESARPLAYGFGVETALTIDLLTAGRTLTEVDVPLEHRATGTDWRAQLHRGVQFRDVARALAVREVPPSVRRRLQRFRRAEAGATPR